MGKQVTDQDQPDENTLNEDLAAALEEAMQEENEEETEKESEEEEKEEETEEEEKEEEAEEEESEEEEAEEEEEALEAPQHWAVQDRESFATLSRQGQEFMLRRHKEMEADYTRKTQEVAAIRKKAEAISEVFEPHRQELALNGLDEVSAVRQLLAIRDELRADPKTTLLSLAQQFGVDLSTTEETDIDPSVLALRKELNDVKQEQARREQEAQQQSQQTLVQQVEDFAQAKDEKGELKHPHFETIRTDMGRMIQSGLAADMEEAYAKVLSLRPELAPPPLKQEPGPSKKERVKKAKKAAAGVRSSGAAEKSEPKTLRQELEAQLSGMDD